MATCPECGESFPYKAPGAGPRKKVRCPACDNVIVPIPDKTPARAAQAPAKRKPETKPAPPPPPAPAPAGGLVPGMDDEVVGFADYEDPTEVRRKREEEEAKTAKVKQKKAEVKVKIRNIGDLERWTLVDRGLMLIQFGSYSWTLAMLLQALALILGMISGPDYNNIALEFLYTSDGREINVGESEPLQLLRFMLAYIYGRDFWFTCYILILIGNGLYYLQAGLWITGYFLLLRGCPERYGARFQGIFLVSIGSFNLLVHLFLILLPLCQAYEFVICPLLGPEMALGSFGTHRRFPLPVQWTNSPVFDAMTAIILFTSRYLETLMIGVYIWTVGLNIREEEVENKGMGVMIFSMATLFMMLCFQLGAVSGTSPVLVGMLRAIYFLWFMFTAGIVLAIATGCHKSREVLAKYLTGQPT